MMHRAQPAKSFPMNPPKRNNGAERYRSAPATSKKREPLPMYDVTRNEPMDMPKVQRTISALS